MALNRQLWDGDPHQEVNLSVPVFIMTSKIRTLLSF